MALFAQEGYETITFPSQDGLTITANLYKPHGNQAPFIVLCHQAGWSRGEYLEIAPKLNAMGFNCMAIDQRSGKGVNNTANATAKAASKAGKATGYIDAYQDLAAAVAYARSQYAAEKLLLWGSSYSAALALRYAGEQGNTIDAVLSFAPGEYFGSPNYIAGFAKGITIPAYITSAKREKKNWWAIYQGIPAEGKAYFIPDGAGNHGSRALWEKFADHTQYWEATTAFLNSFL